LIESVRDKNGYRQFDMIMMKKLERIQMMRFMGFSISEIKSSLCKGKMRENGDLAFQSRFHKIDEQMRCLAIMKKTLAYNQKLSQSYEEYYQNPHRYDNFACCVKSIGNQNCEQAMAWKQDVDIFHVNEDYSLEADGVFQNAVCGEAIRSDDVCRKCKEQNVVNSPAIRSVIKISEEAKMQEMIQRMYSFGEKRGYELGRKVYALYSYYCESNEEGIVCDLYIPIKE
jgi:DNA-binding transcriptional MerR regulator